MKLLEARHLEDTRLLFERAAADRPQSEPDTVTRALAAADQAVDQAVSEDRQTGLRTVPQRSCE